MLLRGKDEDIAVKQVFDSFTAVYAAYVYLSCIRGGYCMSRIAIIDTLIDSTRIAGKVVAQIDLCDDNDRNSNNGLSHGTICAMVLDHCASDYELINICIFKDNKRKVFGEIELLTKALELCRELQIDIISLSVVSSILSDSKHLLNVTRELSDKSIIVGALDNKLYVTVPTSYQHVLGVRHDFMNLLSHGELAYCENDPYGANVYANCNFSFLPVQEYMPSNSYAVPVVAAYLNGLLNQGHSTRSAKDVISDLKPYYPGGKYDDLLLVTHSPDKLPPVVFVSDINVNMLYTFMDSLYTKYEVQSTALALVNCFYDIRVKAVVDITTIEDDLYFMEQHYKTDLIFIVGKLNQLEMVCKGIDVDVKVFCGEGSNADVVYENKLECVPVLELVDRLHDILTTK